MALDSAEFISELSILDPPGTDPLNQGDDHIRTVKRATQQSFPLVDAPVPISAAQMAQMAIKNEVNTFTVAQQFNSHITIDGQIKAGAGLAAAPGVSFFAAQDTGMFRNTGQLGFSVDGTQRLQLTAASMFPNVPQLLMADGSAALPAYSFLSRSTTGMYASAGDRINWATSGVQRAFLDVSQFQVKVPITAIDGIETAPGYTFASDLGTGIFASATSCNISANGQLIAAFTSSSDIFAGVGRSWAGQTPATAARPAFNFNSDPDTGFYNAAANSIGWATAGVARGTMDASAIWCADGVSIHGDAAGDVSDPAFAFTNDTDSGLFRAAANSVSIAAGGVSILNFDQGTSAMWSGAGMHFRMDGGTLPATPVYSFSNDTDTGMYRRAANAIGFASGGAEIFNIGSGGIGVISGKLCFLNLPTSAGTSGSLWNSSGVVRVA